MHVECWEKLCVNGDQTQSVFDEYDEPVDLLIDSR